MPQTVAFICSLQLAACRSAGGGGGSEPSLVIGWDYDSRVIPIRMGDVFAFTAEQTKFPTSPMSGRHSCLWSICTAPSRPNCAAAMDNAGLSFMDEVFALLLDGPTSNEDAQSGIESLATIGPRGGRKQRRRRRRRPKDELDALRNEIEELRNRRKQLRSPPVLDDDADSGWREVALSQRCQAERAREANRQLRELLEQQGELAQDLWHKLQIRIRAMVRCRSPQSS